MKWMKSGCEAGDCDKSKPKSVSLELVRDWREHYPGSVVLAIVGEVLFVEI